MIYFSLFRKFIIAKKVWSFVYNRSIVQNVCQHYAVHVLSCLSHYHLMLNFITLLPFPWSSDFLGLKY